jgi:hypothetical protein
MEPFSLPDIPIWPVVKVFVVVALFLYLVFALVVVRQVQLMTDTLEVDFESVVRLLTVAHLVFAITVFILALVIL